MSDFEIRITPEPSPEDRQAILAAVRTVLDSESDRARPATWTSASWTGRRVGASDLSRTFPLGRTWVLSARLPWGGMEFAGLAGRGDVK